MTSVLRLRPASSPPEQRRSRLKPLLLAGFLAQVLVRLVLAYGRTGPLILADEIGYLAHARVLAGGVDGEMSQATFYRGGYSLLIAPAYLLSSNPVRVYHLILVINALLGAAAFPLLYALLRDTFAVPVRRALTAAFVTTTAPSLVLGSLLAWPEALLVPLFLLVLLALDRWIRSGRFAWSVLLGLSTAMLAVTHGRMSPVVALLLLAVVAAALVRPVLRLPAGAVVVVTVVVYLGGSLLNNWLRERNYDDVKGDGTSVVLDHLKDPGVVRNVVGMGLGQYWYLIVASAGMFGLGVLALVGLARGGGRRPWVKGPEALSAALVSIVVLLALVGLALVAAVYLFPPDRPDKVVYGRYLEVVAPLAVALGLARLWEPRPLRLLLREVAAVLSVLVIALLVIHVYADHLLGRPLTNIYNILAVPGFAVSATQVRALQVTVLILVLVAALVLLSRRGRAVGAVLLVIVFLGTAAVTRDGGFGNSARSIYGPKLDDRVVLPGLRHGEIVDYDMAAYTIEGLWAFQWEQPNAHFQLFRSNRGQLPHSRLVISGARWSQAQQLGARMVWRDPQRDQAVWELPTR